MGDVKPLKSRWWGWGVVGIVVAVLVLAVGWYALTDGEAAPVVREPGSVDVELVESGFTFTLIDDTYWEASVGAVVKNTGEQAALAAISFNYLDNEGNIHWTDAFSRVFYIEPGESVPIGTTHFAGTASDLSEGEVGNLTDVDILVHAFGVGDPGQVSRRSVDVELVEHQADDVVLDFERLDGFVFRFDSGYDETTELLGIGMVFRDESGAIIGGSDGFPEYRYYEADPRPAGIVSHRLKVPAGESALVFHSLAPPGVDMARTEVVVAPFVDPGLNDWMWNCARCIDREDGEVAPTPPYSTWFR